MKFLHYGLITIGTIFLLSACGPADPKAEKVAMAPPVQAPPVAKPAVKQPPAAKQSPTANQSAAAIQPPVLKKADPGNLDFADSSKFDSQLSDALDGKTTSVTIMSDAAISPNAIPPRLEKWFSAVVKSGGTVKLQKIPTAPQPGQVATRGFLFEIVDLVFTMYDIVHEMVLYAPAQKYDVVVAYDGTSVRDVSFKKRATVQ